MSRIYFQMYVAAVRSESDVLNEALRSQKKMKGMKNVKSFGAD